MPVVVLTSPQIEVGRLDLTRTAGAVSASEPGRMDAFNALLAEFIETAPEVSLIDLAGYVDEISDERVPADLLPDGLHFDDDASDAVAAWLVPALLDDVRDAVA